jgi:hypothetical protein
MRMKHLSRSRVLMLLAAALLPLALPPDFFSVPTRAALPLPTLFLSLTI